MNKIIRVLVVDDSAYVRKVIKQMLSRSPFIEVVGTAHDGEDALEKLERSPDEIDVITLDLLMPKIDGVEFLKRQMERHPIPVIIVSIANEGGELVLAALDAGAVDFVHKPTALATEKMYELAEELIDKVKAAANVPLKRLPVPALGSLPPGLISVQPVFKPGTIDLITIGISTGGPQALAFLIPQLPSNLPVPIAIVLHMPIGYTKMYAERLDQLSALKVVEAGDGEILHPGMVFIAPAGRHLTFKREGNSVVTRLAAQPFDMPHRPSVDVMFQSAAEVYGNRLLGIVMTGMGSDGKQGAAWIKSHGGLIFTESEETCIVYGMPRSVEESGLSDHSYPLNRIAQAILDVL
ncbi:chemotaxis response regulator protein-glutamate methylesterase [Planktothrix sp. FACHB-1365]|uniref:protein-glutamate methylesterase/protein-glutamine glutaminase n=1 Tax=Planktothrix sp. FACHB-1365 TaxID=2692855 RepID=UPI0016890AFD|nr:chemotaxis response regulator protein-glutamate methylesterase [Planktothrix sp. FACHB-1365]MBD2483235.1 chemotaxis response regulator protein-glutamate methylesterase [Planktothrix sp. FACHB-1365]